MSEWEETFGEGVSAESVINGINASYFSDQRQADKHDRQLRVLATSAYKGDATIKAVFLAELDAAVHEGNPLANDRDLATVLHLPPLNFSSLAERLQIPQPLSMLISAIFANLRRSTLFAMPTKEENARATKWLIECFDAITPGVDLRLVVDRFGASLAATAMRYMKKSAYYVTDRHVIAGRAAFDLLCARARGISPPEKLVSDVKDALKSVRDNEAAEYPHNSSAGSAAPTMMAFALEDRPDMMALLAARNDMGNISGDDIVDIHFWWLYSADLIDLIKRAPTTRLRIIDLEQTHANLQS